MFLSDSTKADFTVELSDPNSAIEAAYEGLYEITGVLDATCVAQRDALQSQKFEVNWLIPPSLSFDVSPLPTVNNRIAVSSGQCFGEQVFVPLNFQGTFCECKANSKSGLPPFELTYETYIGGKYISRQQFGTVQRHVNMSLPNAGPGRYHYKFVELSDGIYDAVKLLNISVDHEVFGASSATLELETLSQGQVCETHQGDGAFLPVQVKLTGVSLRARAS